KRIAPQGRGTLFALQGRPKVRIAPPSGAAQRRQPQARDTLLTSIGIHDAARTLRHLAPIAVAKAYADALVTHDAAQKPFGLTAVQLFGELRPAIDNGTWGCRHASSRRNGVGSDLGCVGRSRRRGDSRRDGRTALGR